MKKLHSFAFYALVAPVMTLGAGTLLAQHSINHDPASKDAKKTEQAEKDTQRARQSDTLPATDRRDARDHSRMQNRGYIASAPARGMHASNLMGAKVKTNGDEEVGPVSDLIIDEDGQIAAIVVGVGGFLGMGEKDVAIGWDHVTRLDTSGEQVLQIDLTRDNLRAAPKFDARSIASRTDRNDQGALRDRQSDTLAATDRRDTRAQSHVNKRGYLESSPVNGMQVSTLIGADVKTSDDEDVGVTSDLIIDEDGQVVAIVVGAGGFLGMGEKDVAIGWGHVTRSGSGDEQDLKIDVTRESLRSAPAFETRE